jgi:hypothetical protein
VAHVPDTGNPEELRAAVAAIIAGIKGEHDAGLHDGQGG